MKTIQEMAREAGVIYSRDDYIPKGLKAFAALVREDELEAIKDEYWMSVQSDLEHGVKSLNERAAKQFQESMPELSKFGEWLEARSNT